MSASDDADASPAVVLSLEGAIASISLNRPKALNALTPELATSLLGAIETVAADTEVRLLIVRGVGRAFMAGGDLVYLRDSTPEEAFARSGALIDQLNAIVRALSNLTIPTLAVAHGAVAGAGLSLLLACDYAIATDDTRFVYAYNAIAASPDGGLSRALVGLLGYRRAIELAFLGSRLPAAEAHRLGIVTELASTEEFEARTQELAARLVQLPLRAFVETKRLMQAAQGIELDAQLERERDAFQRCSQTGDLREGVLAFFEQRPARFADNRL